MFYNLNWMNKHFKSIFGVLKVVILYFKGFFVCFVFVYRKDLRSSASFID